MGRKPAFGRPGVLDRLRQWWYAKARSFRVNCLLGLAVGTVAVALVAAALGRDPAPGTGLVNAATRPHLTEGSLPNPPVTVDLRATGMGSPLALPEQPPSSSTTSTVAATPVLPAQAPPSSTRPPTTVAGTVPALPTTAPRPKVIYTEVPFTPPPAADATVPPLPTTAPPGSVPAPPPTSPPPTSPPATSPSPPFTLLPPISLPPLLP